MPEGFEKALSAFQTHAASKLQVAADQLGIVPKSEALARDWKVPSGRTDLLPIVGRAWAFEAAKVVTPFPTERGWALPDGTIITREQNLGRLFQEAGLWDKAPTMPFSEVAIISAIRSVASWRMGVPSTTLIVWSCRPDCDSGVSSFTISTTRGAARASRTA